MITNIQLRFLKQLIKGEVTKSDNPKLYNMTMQRIQEQLDDGFAKLLWIAENRVDLLKDDKTEIEDDAMERYRRFRALAYVLGKMNPMTEIEDIRLSDVLKKLSQLYPKYYFEVIKKGKE